MKTYRFILLVQQNYSFEILRPLQQEMRVRGDEILWLALGREVDTGLFAKEEAFTRDMAKSIAFNPDAIFVCGNVVPDFIPGLKVQIFHGFEWKKKGHFRIRGSFDLYCTQGPLFTRKFNEFAMLHGYFDVVETGWPKMDNVFPLPRGSRSKNKKQILYLPTFSPKLTSAIDLFNEIDSLASLGLYEIIVKFHPKMARHVIAQYMAMAQQHDNVTVYAKADLMGLIRECDVVLSDTSSAIAESLLHRKPVITYRNSMPDEYIIDFEAVDKLHDIIHSVFANTARLDDNFDRFAAEYHPLCDGKASQRVIAAAVQRIEHGLIAKKKKPSNFFRNFKLLCQEKFWPWSKQA